MNSSPFAPIKLDLVCHLGRHQESVPFRVELLPNAINHLIADARQAYRVYELMMIQRPGDVWKYIWVRTIDVPPNVVSRIEDKKHPDSYRKENWPESCIPLPVFDTFFYWCWDDTSSESDTWLTKRESKDFTAISDKLFAEVQQAQGSLRSSADVLIQAELAALDAHQHHHDHDAQLPAEITFPDYASQVVPKRSVAYYEKLQELLARPDVFSVSSRDDKDYPTLRLLAEEQRRRAIASGQPIGHDMTLHVLSDGFKPFDCWAAPVVMWQEGLGYGDLLLDGDRNHGLAYFASWPSHARRLALTHHAENIDLPGYIRTEGDGWVFYEDTRPNQNYAERSQKSRQEYIDRLKA